MSRSSSELAAMLSSMSTSDKQELGKRMAQTLVVDWRRSLIRTTETIRFSERDLLLTEYERQLFLPDFDSLPHLEDLAVFPLARLRKLAYLNPQVEDLGNGPAFVLQGEVRREITFLTLAWLVEAASQGANRNDPLLEQALRQIVSTEPRTSAAALEMLLASYGTAASKAQSATLFESSLLATLFSLLASEYIFYVALRDVGRRERSFRYSYERGALDTDGVTPLRANLRRRVSRALAWRPHHIDVLLGDVGDGGGHHIEVVAPPGIRAERRDLLLGNQPARSANGISSSSAVFYIPPQEPGTPAVLRVRFRPADPVMLAIGPLAAAAATLLIGLFAWRIPSEVDAAVTALLVVPGAGSLLAIRPGEHPFVRKVIAVIRRLDGVPAILSATAGAVLVANFGSTATRVILGGLAVMSAAVLIILLSSLRYSTRTRPREERIDNDLLRVA